METQKVVETSIGRLIVSPLNLAEIGQLHKLLSQAKASGDCTCLKDAIPVFLFNVQRRHPELTMEAMEQGLTFADLSALIMGVLEISGAPKAVTPTGDKN